MKAHCTLLIAVLMLPAAAATAQSREPLSIQWERNYLTISADWLSGPISINYLEAYCRPGSTDREWGETVIKHRAELVSVSEDRRVIKLRDTLDDGVVVDHTITAGNDDVDFRIVAHNPTARVSEAHWAQPCIRVDKFAGVPCDDARSRVPAYARQCFLFLNDQLTMLPTTPWAEEARYVPGQVYCPAHVNRNDVNPRPLSELVPSNGLCGCYNRDRTQIFATCFEPYQEIFQGVICCMHNDFRIGGLEPGETKNIRGKIYLLPADEDQLIKRHARDFPEQARRQND